MKKLVKRNAVVLVVGMLALVSLLIIMLPAKDQSSKIIDPLDPKFSIENFDWDDYKSAEELAEVFKIIFPIGTDKGFIEKVLLAKPGTKTVGPIIVKDHISKTGGILAGHVADKILYQDPRFKNVYAFMIYNHPLKSPFFSFSSSAGGRATVVYYDEQNRLLNAIVYITIVHQYETISPKH